jgi:probable rRNA maturation factor
MNQIDISCNGTKPPLPFPALKAFVQAALALIGKDNWDVSLVFCKDAEMQRLNKAYRGRDEPTDVLSFPLGDEYTLEHETRRTAGDIVISTDTLRENSAFFKVNELDELRRLLVHGLLHLAGNDHETNDPSEPMLVLQEEILGKLKA